MKRYLLIISSILCVYGTPTAQTYQLGASLDGFLFSTADRTESYGGATYQFWDKTAANTNTAFLLESDGFSNKWQNGNVDYDQEETLFFGDGGSPDAQLTTPPTSGRHYVFKIRQEGYANLPSIVMELSNAPVTFTSVNQTPAGSPVPANEDLTVTATLSASPSPEEQVFLRYSTDGFATYGTIIVSNSPSAATQVFTIPGQNAGVTVNYYLFTTTLSSGTITGNDALTNLGTIHISNNSGANFTALFPVEFSSFEVKSEQDGNRLYFTTASEANNDFFEIERSTDSRSWHKLGQLNGANNTNRETHYVFLDSSPAEGENYYRIKQVDDDGTFHFSTIVSMYWFSKERVRVFPNPASSAISLRGIAEDLDQVTIEILDVNGRLVLKREWKQEAIDISGLKAGLYSLRISSLAGIIDHQRLVVGF